MSKRALTAGLSGKCISLIVHLHDYYRGEEDLDNEIISREEYLVYDNNANKE